MGNNIRRHSNLFKNIMDFRNDRAVRNNRTYVVYNDALFIEKQIDYLDLNLIHPAPILF